LNSVEDVVTTSAISGVDCLLLGRQPLPREGLGTRRMTELLEKLRKRYTLVIIDGPPASQTVDLEMLAARADGIIFTSHGTRADFGNNMDAVRNLMELDAPILGVIG
jgi:Mrp family chromosome partitioning ATPase